MVWFLTLALAAGIAWLFYAAGRWEDRNRSRHHFYRRDALLGAGLVFAVLGTLGALNILAIW